jgi:hypothetical protein
MAADRGELVRVYEFAGHRVELDGYIDPAKPEAGYDYYDLFDAEDGTCLNLGDPLYAIPTEAEVRMFLEPLEPGDTTLV